MKHIITGIAVAATAALALGTITPAQAAEADGAERRAGTKSLARVLAADGNRLDRNWQDFDILERGVLTVLKAKPDSPVALLTQGRKRATAFLPTDAAFRALVKDISGTAPRTERATFRALASVADVDTLQSVLLYHVVAGRTLTAKKVVKADGTRIRTANGAKIGIRVQGKRVVITDLDRNDRNARVVVTDINKGNRQVGHAINRVLRPIDLP